MLGVASQRPAQTVATPFFAAFNPILELHKFWPGSDLRWPLYGQEPVNASHQSVGVRRSVLQHIF